LQLQLAGIHYNERGEYNPWLTETARRAFEKRLNCVAEQYHRAFVRQVPFMGSQTNVEVTGALGILSRLFNSSAGS
jgi:predicted metalloendopeptidase